MKTKAQIIDEIIAELPPPHLRGEMTNDEWFEWFLDAFDAGLNYAIRWIPIEEELPRKKYPMLGDLVLTKHTNGGFEINRYDFMQKRFIDGFIPGNVTHWRYINFEI